jgi:hypothetical protein
LGSFRETTFVVVLIFRVISYLLFDVTIDSFLLIVAGNAILGSIILIVSYFIIIYIKDSPTLLRGASNAVRFSIFFFTTGL